MVVDVDWNEFIVYLLCLVSLSRIFQVLVGLMVIFTITVSVLSIFITISIKKEKAMEDAFHGSLEPTEINEERYVKFHQGHIGRIFGTGKSVPLN